MLLLGVRRVSGLLDQLVPAVLVSLVELLNLVAVALGGLVNHVSQALLCELTDGDALGVILGVNVEDSEKAKKGTPSDPVRGVPLRETVFSLR